MKSWDMNTIISCGLVVMGVIAVLGWIALSYKTGTSSGTEIPIAIVSGLVGVLTGQKLQERKQQQSQVGQALEQMATVAGEGQKIVEAAENLKDVFKKKEEKS